MKIPKYKVLESMNRFHVVTEDGRFIDSSGYPLKDSLRQQHPSYKSLKKAIKVAKAYNRPDKYHEVDDE